MPKINYNPEAQIMSIQVSNKKSVDSDTQGNIVIDYDNKGEIARIEIMSISLNEFKKNGKYFKDFFAAKRKKANAFGFAMEEFAN